MSQEIQTAPAKNDIKALISGDRFRDEVAKALPSHLTPERFIRVALTAMNRTPKLAACTQTSLFKCLLDLSALGLEPDGRNAHLIPYGTEATLIVDWKGLVALAKRSGDVASWSAELVCEKDEFSWENGIVNHKIDWRDASGRGELQCVYSRVVMKDGTLDFEVMTLTEVEAIRKRSRSGNSGPWVTDFAEMAKKTVIRRHSKRLTLSPEFANALDKDGDRFDERVERQVPAKAPFPQYGPKASTFADPEPSEPAEADPILLE